MNNRFSKAVYIILFLAVVALLAPPNGGGPARAQVSLPRVPGNLGQRLPQLPEIEERVRQRAERTVEQVDDTLDAAASFADDTLQKAAGLVDSTLRPFVADRDPAGAEIERDIIVVLADESAVAAIRHSGAVLLAERELPSLERTMLTLQRPDGVALPEAVEALHGAYPGAAVDFNHVYRYAGETGDAAGASAAADGEAADGAAVRIGIVDSAVMPEHPALSDNRIVVVDFVPHEGARPLGHGTAVASLAVQAGGRQVEIQAASVFFQLPDQEPGASTESIVAALDWLAAEHVDTINMSLAGPGNRLLEAAVAELTARGGVIVAAVGNNGPAGEPLYPAAYEGVIGVTAVDRDKRVFRYANRGEHVDYAALGVDVKVANSRTGGWTTATGTSMASPHVAVVAAQTLHASAVDPAALESWLIAGAEDLGRKGFDPVFGHGLVTRPPRVVSAN